MCQTDWAHGNAFIPSPSLLWSSLSLSLSFNLIFSLVLFLSATLKREYECCQYVWLCTHRFHFSKERIMHGKQGGKRQKKGNGDRKRSERVRNIICINLKSIHVCRCHLAWKHWLFAVDVFRWTDPAEIVIGDMQL